MDSAQKLFSWVEGTDSAQKLFFVPNDIDYFSQIWQKVRGNSPVGNCCTIFANRPYLLDEVLWSGKTFMEKLLPMYGKFSKFVVHVCILFFQPEIMFNSIRGKVAKT